MQWGGSMMSRVLAGIAMVMAVATTAAADPTPAALPSRAPHAIPAPPDPTAIPLLSPAAGTPSNEQWEQSVGGGRSIRNVTVPTLTPFLPDPAKATGVAVIVAPGGAFYSLGIDDEGNMVARWLADHGVAAFVLKYRLEPTPRDWAGYQAVLTKRLVAAAQGQPIATPPQALDDAKAAVRLVRARAAEWRVDPARVGFLGFSAGALNALSVGLTDDKQARPDFIAPIYGSLAPRPVPADAPAMFVAIALDDPLFASGKSLGLIDAWRKAGRPLEAHLYQRGGHGFVRGKSAATKLWIEEFYAWMQDRGLVKPGQ
jgi:acetyl esterase/lipase